MAEAGVSAVEGSLLNNFVDTFIPGWLVTFLGKTLYQNSWFLLNNWSFVHLGAGVLFYFIKRKIFPKWTFRKLILWWIFIDILYEILEFILAMWGHPIFVEIWVDIFWDLVMTIGAFILTGWIFEKRRGKRIKAGKYLEDVVEGKI